MIIKSLELAQFRNYEQLNISFDKGINILYGDNAQGKTNVLEAIYLASTTKSHKNSKDRDMITFEQDEAHIRTNILKNEIDYKVDMHLHKGKTKGIAINGLKIKKASDLLGLINIVVFSPEDLTIIKDGPSARRRFIDMELCQLDKSYLFHLNNYNKIIIQRNKLLRDIYFDKTLLETLDVWDEQLVFYGTKIIERRSSFIKELNQIVYEMHKKLSGEREELHLKYDPDIEINNFKGALIKKRDRDMKLGQTSVGPHKDDCIFMIGEEDIRKFGSQGQQRTAALSLKLSEIALVKKIIKDTPILLLDDVLSELDSNRQKQLLDSINDIQTIITCTGLDEFINNRFEINKIFKVTNGSIMNEN
ncbi:MAG: DNA replication/repair protein RecF [Lachnospiraceae bacterium]